MFNKGVKKYIFIDVENLPFLNCEVVWRVAISYGYVICPVGYKNFVDSFISKNNLKDMPEKFIKRIDCDIVGRNSTDLLIACMIGVVYSNTTDAKTILLTMDKFGVVLKNVLLEQGITIDAPLDMSKNRLKKGAKNAYITKRIIESL